jgi:prolyl oligopeptidase
VAGKPKWDVVLDIDKLAKDEGENWVYKGYDCLGPDNVKCIMTLSPGGTDASVYREFDMKSKSFVKGGFEIPLAKSSASWVDENTLLVGTDWGSDSMTDSGYARTLKIWKRGTDLSEAQEVITLDKSETFVFPSRLSDGDDYYQIIMRGHTFYEASRYILGQDYKPMKLPFPSKMGLEGIFKGQMLMALKEDWRGFKAGSLISFPIKKFLSSGKIDQLTLVLDPGMEGTVRRVTHTKDALYISMLEHVSTRIREYKFDGKKWDFRKKDLGAKESRSEDVVSIVSSDSEVNHMLIARDGFLTPNSLYFVNFQTGEQKKLQSIPHRFDVKGLRVEKKWAVSKDGTKIPYFIVHKKGTKMDKNTPVLQYGYGGFDISILPHYNGLMGKLWLEKGGAYVLANIRGGGEYGPRWHEAALFEKRQRAYEDFFAVAETVQASGLSSPQHYGAKGGSNGGLLMGVAFTQRPDLFNAIICAVPLLDMKRYNKLLAGASWMGEYGNPDKPEEWAYIRKYSPLQNLKKGIKYPKVYFFTSTKDDRVHPAHARKMAAKMEIYGQPFYYFENIEGGHKGTANYDQEATMRALEYLYLMKELK